MKNLLRKIIPAGILNFILRNRHQRHRENQRQRRNASKTFTAVDCKLALQDLGINRSDNLIVHSSMSSFNKTDFSVSDLKNIFIDLIGENGTLVVPSFGGYLKSISEDYFFDVKKSRSEMGVFAEYIRRLPSSARSLHPTHNVSAHGALSEYMVKDHIESPIPFSTYSPYYKNMAINGKVILFGVNLNSFTSFHIYEDLLGNNFPLEVYLKEPRKFKIHNINGEQILYTGKVHNLELAYKRNVEILRKLYIDSGAMRVFKTDFSEISLIDPKLATITNLEALKDRFSAYGKIKKLSNEMKNIIDKCIFELKQMN